MVLSNADLERIKSVIISVFNDKFMDDISEKIRVIVEKKFEDRIQSQDNTISKLLTKIDDLENKNKSFSMALDNQEQSMRNLNIRIFGIAAENGEDLRSVVLNLFNKTLKVTVKNPDIQKCYRVSGKNPGDKPPAVIVRFSNDAIRYAVLKNRRALKNNVKIKEDLTKYRLRLFHSAINQFSSKNSWVANGCVYVKCDEVVRRISNENEINELLDN